MPGRWTKGMQSPNPSGRPKKEREYATLIERELSRYIQVEGDTRATAKKRVIARMLVQAVLTGEITFYDQDGKKAKITRVLDAETWISYVLRLLKHLEGDVPERKEHEFVNDLPLSMPGIERLLERVYGDAAGTDDDQQD